MNLSEKLDISFSLIASVTLFAASSYILRMDYLDSKGLSQNRQREDIIANSLFYASAIGGTIIPVVFLGCSLLKYRELNLSSKIN